ncbi:MAG TPA: hypothetical protein PLB10_15280 [Thiolinea sp.]|nr:hypothetical protein [Thiolinea sp.]
MSVRLLLSRLPLVLSLLLGAGGAQAHGGHAHIGDNLLHLFYHSGLALLIGLGVFFLSRRLIRRLKHTRKPADH